MSENAFTKMIEDGKNMAEDIADQASDKIKETLPKIGEFSGQAIEHIQQLASDSAKQMKPLVQKVSDSVKPVVDGVKPVVENVQDAVKPAVNQVHSAVKPVVSQVQEAMSPVINQAKDFTADKVSDAQQAFKKAQKTIAPTVAELTEQGLAHFNDMKDIGAQKLGELQERGAKDIEAVRKVSQERWEDVATATSQQVDKLSKRAMKAKKQAKRNAQKTLKKNAEKTAKHLKREAKAAASTKAANASAHKSGIGGWLLAGALAVGAAGTVAYAKFRKDRQDAQPGNALRFAARNVKPVDNSPMEGKFILALGSSITEGSAAYHDSFLDYIANRDSLKVKKVTADGSTLVDDDDNSYVSRLLSVSTDLDPDLILCQVSTNDVRQGKPLGEVSDSRDLIDLNTHTMLGALEYVIGYCQEMWDAPVCLYTSAYFESEDYQALVDALDDLADKWDVEIIDLYSDDEFNDLTDDERDYYMADEIHPTRLGYVKWWAPYFEDVFVELIGEPIVDDDADNDAVDDGDVGDAIDNTAESVEDSTETVADAVGDVAASIKEKTEDVVDVAKETAAKIAETAEDAANK